MIKIYLNDLLLFLFFKVCTSYVAVSWSHTQVQMGNGAELGFSIDITLR